ncbi:hypothetical protein ILUMI_15312, partial [Ignelater luminosus]
KKRGRPDIPFESCSERTKRRKTEELRESTPVSVLSYATQMGLRAEGQSQASRLLKEITNTSPTRASKYRTAYKKSLEPEHRKPAEDALAVLVDGKSSCHQYDVIRTSAPEIFPSYKTVQAAKKLCYPKDINVTETYVVVTLQALLDHTVKRLLLKSLSHGDHDDDGSQDGNGDDDDDLSSHSENEFYL